MNRKMKMIKEEETQESERIVVIRTQVQKEVRISKMIVTRIRIIRYSRRNVSMSWKILI